MTHDQLQKRYSQLQDKYYDNMKSRNFSSDAHDVAVELEVVSFVLGQQSKEEMLKNLSGAPTMSRVFFRQYGVEL
jgi:hypothetical protein